MGRYNTKDRNKKETRQPKAPQRSSPGATRTVVFLAHP
jgi:hypothetical protein